MAVFRAGIRKGIESYLDMRFFGAAMRLSPPQVLRVLPISRYLPPPRLHGQKLSRGRPATPPLAPCCGCCAYPFTNGFQFLSGFQTWGTSPQPPTTKKSFQFLSGFQRSLITVGYGFIYVYPIIFSTFVEIYCS